MKITSLKLSNILSFKYCDNPECAETIVFDPNINIIIGQNGSGKSTALEAINLIFRRVIFKHCPINYELYSRRRTVAENERKKIITMTHQRSLIGFRLTPNWNTESNRQHIILELKLDDVDIENINAIRSNLTLLSKFSQQHSDYSFIPEGMMFPQGIGILPINEPIREYKINVEIMKNDNSFLSSITPSESTNWGAVYLTDYNFYRALIYFYNLENPNAQLPQLYESFALIGGYRNYTTFTPSVSLSDNLAGQQMENIIGAEFSQSLNSSESSEPRIFSLVRLRLAEKHYNSFGSMTQDECQNHANNQAFLQKINNMLKLIGLKLEMKIIDKKKWQYDFQFYDVKRGSPLADISSLSSGQKAIIHLIFESFGRGELKGGLILIDEPELHLHYQWQHEYLNIVEVLNEEQRCQYILVTHSESFINSKTIRKIKRFALDEHNYSVVMSPNIDDEGKTLIKILDSSRAGFAFFANKILLVEGETDHFFYKQLLELRHKKHANEIAIIAMSDKNQRKKYTNFFSSFGLSVYFIGDLDVVLTEGYEEKSRPSIENNEHVNALYRDHPDAEIKIENFSKSKIYILRQGVLEMYLMIDRRDNVNNVINFCDTKLNQFVQENTPYARELISIIDNIVGSKSSKDP